jgi:hypothetical protein
MSDERRDDEILGRALSRAIETIDVNQTPFERSRIATAPPRRSIFGWSQLGFAGVGILLAVALGSWLTRPTEDQPGVAASPSATASPVPSVAPSASAVIATSVPTWVYFARDSLPPVGAFIPGYPPSRSSSENQIQTRISALHNYALGQVPAGAINPLASAAPSQGGSSRFGLGVRIQGDLATVEFDLSSGWGVRGDAQSLALLQQLVYTITEEPGIRRALITETGKPNAVIDQLVVDKPLTREDVFGYTSKAASGTISIPGDDKTPHVGANLVSRDIQDGTRVELTFEGRNRSGSDAKAPLPTITISFQPNEGAVPHNRADGPAPGYVLTVAFQWNRGGSSGGVGHVERIDRTPLRAIAGDGNTAYQVWLDDARPWRAYMPDPTRLVLEIGGDPRATSESVAVNSPKPRATTGRTLTVSGAARAFEAQVVWRVKDSSGRVVANGFTLASLGSSALWGTFQTSVAIPANVSGNVTLEVFWPSPRDGTELGLVQIPLTVR